MNLQQQKETPLTSDCGEYLDEFTLFISIYVSRGEKTNRIALVSFSLKVSSAYISSLMISGKTIIEKNDMDLFQFYAQRSKTIVIDTARVESEGNIPSSLLTNDYVWCFICSYKN